VAALGDADHHRDHHADHHQPDRDFDDVARGDHQLDVAHGVHADDYPARGDNQPDADPHADDPAGSGVGTGADDAAGSGVGTGADDAGSAEIALSGLPRRHRYTGVP
jgi:hypothetical protein